MTVLVPKRKPPKPSDVHALFHAKPIDFLALLDPPLPPLSYHSLRGHTSGASKRASRGQVDPPPPLGGSRSVQHQLENEEEVARPSRHDPFAGRFGPDDEEYGGGFFRMEEDLPPEQPLDAVMNELTPTEQPTAPARPAAPPPHRSRDIRTLQRAPLQLGGADEEEAVQRSRPGSAGSQGSSGSSSRPPSSSGSGLTLAGLMDQSLALRTRPPEPKGKRGRQQGGADENAPPASRPGSSGGGAAEKQPKRKRLSLKKGAGKDAGAGSGAVQGAAASSGPSNRTQPAAAGGGGISSRPSPASGPTELTGDMFRGLERICTLVGESDESLASFTSLCERSAVVYLALLFPDLSSTLSPLSKKFCTPKASCPRWNCACDKHIRADRASTDVIAALFLIDDRAYFLPLAASARSKKASFTLPLADITTSKDQRFMCLADVLCLETCVKVCFNTQVALMPFLGWLIARDENSPSFLRSLLDPKIAAWIVETAWKESDLELDALLSRFLPRQPAGRRPSDALGSVQKAGDVAMAVAAVLDSLARIRDLWGVLKAKLVQANSYHALMTMEMPMACLLSSMEVHGVGFQRDAVPRIIGLMDDKKDALAQQIHAQAGCAFNVDSPEQVADVLYTRLRLPAPSTTQGAANKKHATTSEEALVKLKDRHPIADLILRYRTIAKIKHTYLEALGKHSTSSGPMSRLRTKTLGQCNHRIHAQWNQMTVRTGRLSTNKPALQTIPKTFEQEGITINIRNLIVASAGCLFLSADYSQIEMRVLAHCTQDQRLIQLFRSNGDIYKLLMSDLLKKPVDQVTDAERDQAKTVALGMLYGMGPAAAANRLNIPLSDAQALFRRFYSTYPRVEHFMETTRASARRNGYVRTILGRVRHIPNIMSGDTGLRAQAERQAVNSIIQGSASDIIKMAMISAQQAIDERWGMDDDEAAMMDGGQGGTSRPATPRKPTLVMQIHDELVFDCPAQSECVTALRDIIKTAMETGISQHVQLQVQLEIKLAVGRTLGSLRPVPSSGMAQTTHTAS